jgi:hypothetical protein
VLDPDPDELDETLLAIASGFGEPPGPARGVCMSIRQEWEMIQVSPGYWGFLIGEAVASESRTHMPPRSKESKARFPHMD